MIDFYELDVLPIIFNKFKVSNIVISGNQDNNVIKYVLNYCKHNNVLCNVIDFQEEYSKKDSECSFDYLSKLNNYDAIFLNGDANWYVLFNELKNIKQNNNEFPLVFICNNMFPYKRRDSYINPNLIPKEYRHEFSKFLLYNYGGIEIQIYDGLFHANEENTPKNGVLTAIEDFIIENSNINILDIKLVDGTTILYSNNNINYFRINSIKEKIKDFKITSEKSIDLITENQMLINHIAKSDISKIDSNTLDDYQYNLKKKDIIINNYEDKIQHFTDEINYKNSQIEGVKSKLNLKDTQIKSFESKLNNKNNEIDDLNAKLNNLNIQFDSLKEYSELIKNKESNLSRQIVDANNQIESLRVYLSETENNFSNRELQLINQIEVANDLIKKNEIQLKEKEFNISQINNQISLKDQILEEQQISLKLINEKYISQLSKLDNKEYCISCYQEEICNNHLEIEYLKKYTLIKKFFAPIAYLYLILKSNPKEISLNYKLYKALKNSKCFDIGFYLNNNKDLLGSKWCKYFSPELHYVCKGFSEERTFNKKYFNRNSKEELLNYIINCQ